MATKKISELEEINQAENDDYLVVVDTSESKNKKITKENFLKISALEEKISDLENNQLTASTEGTSIDINDSADYQVREMIPNGNVVQNSTTGKNLLENTYATSGTQSGITHAKNADGTMLLNGTATTTVFMILNTFNLAAGTYILSGCPNGGSENGYRQDILVENNVVVKDFGSGGSFTLNENTSIQARIRIGSGTAINNLTFKPMIRLSSITDVSYEPYTGGIASPNPQYEQPINSAGDNINLFDKTANITIGYTYTSTGGTTQLNNCFVQEKYIEVESSKEYILSTTNSYISETDYRLIICEYDSSKNFIKRNLSSTQYYKITTSATTKYVRLCASTVTIDELKFEHGLIATPYTSYGMGSINEVIQNKNLLNIPNNTVTSSGLTATIENGIVSLGGTSTSTSFMFLIRNELSLKAGTYTISAFNDNASSDDTTDLRVTNKNGDGIISRVYLNIINASLTFTLNTDLEEGCLQIRSGSGNTFNNFVIKPQLKLGSSATSFVPHQEQNISIPCQQPMRSIGNVRDSFVKIDGVWYEKHVIGQVVLKGNETWYMTNDGSFKRFSTLISDLEQFTVRKSNLLSNYYIGSTTSGIGIIYSYDKYVYLYPTSDITSVDAFKTWLSTHNTEVIYQLAEPIYLECTEEQITALEQARTYKPVTHILSADVVPAYLGVTYVRDLETVINNLS